MATLSPPSTIPSTVQSQYNLRINGFAFGTTVHPNLVHGIWNDLSLQLTHFNNVLAIQGNTFRRLDTGAAEFFIAIYK